jgi:hypothetical protein
MRSLATSQIHPFGRIFFFLKKKSTNRPGCRDANSNHKLYGALLIELVILRGAYQLIHVPHS